MVILKQKMKVGPKGQVVIPKLFREAADIYPGNEVLFEMMDHRISIEKPIIEDPVRIFEMVAKSGRSVKKIGLHSIEEEIEERWKRAAGAK